jgi:hypothetical protein
MKTASQAGDIRVRPRQLHLCHGAATLCHGRNYNFVTALARTGQSEQSGIETAHSKGRKGGHEFAARIAHALCIYVEAAKLEPARLFRVIAFITAQLHFCHGATTLCHGRPFGPWARLMPFTN